jgi:hypothetical protein
MRARCSRRMLRVRTTGRYHGQYSDYKAILMLSARYRTFALMFKVLFSVGVLSIPSVFAYVGAVPGALQHLCSFPTWVLQAETSKHPCESISLTFHRRYTLMTGSPRHGVCCWRCLVSRSHWSSLHSWVGIHLQSAHTQRD